MQTIKTLEWWFVSCQLALSCMAHASTQEAVHRLQNERASMFEGEFLGPPSKADWVVFQRNLMTWSPTVKEISEGAAKPPALRAIPAIGTEVKLMAHQRVHVSGALHAAYFNTRWGGLERFLDGIYLRHQMLAAYVTTTYTNTLWQPYLTVGVQRNDLDIEGPLFAANQTNRFEIRSQILPLRIGVQHQKSQMGLAFGLFARTVESSFSLANGDLMIRTNDWEAPFTAPPMWSLAASWKSQRGYFIRLNNLRMASGLNLPQAIVGVELVLREHKDARRASSPEVTQALRQKKETVN